MQRVDFFGVGARFVSGWFQGQPKDMEVSHFLIHPGLEEARISLRATGPHKSMFYFRESGATVDCPKI